MLTSRAGGSASFHTVTVTTPTGSQVIADMFANPAAVVSHVRPLILGLDGNSGKYENVTVEIESAVIANSKKKNTVDNVAAIIEWKHRKCTHAAAAPSS